MHASGEQLACDKNVELRAPYDFFVGVAPDFRTFAQPVGSDFGLSQTAIAVVNGNADLKGTRLCNGNTVLVWWPDGTWRPNFLMGRLFDGGTRPLAEEFRVTDSNEEQWEHSVGALYNGNFVVTWKTFSDNKDRRFGGIKIRARVFDSTGHPLTRSINVSTTGSGGNHGQARVYGLMDGDFAVLWHLANNGVYLRIFDGKKGRPKSPEVLVKEINDASRSLIPYGHLSQSGVLNVFLRDARDKSPFSYARSYSDKGVALTDVLTAESIAELDGYQSSVEQIVLEEARRLEQTLRGFLQQDQMASGFCGNLALANNIKELSKSPRMQNFAAKSCRIARSNCPQNEDLLRQVDQCLKLP
jgi:hypothetical protein